MTTLQIPLDKNPDVAALVADMQPGDKIYACLTIQSQDAQTLTARLKEVTDDPDDLPKPAEYSDGENMDEDGDDDEGAPEKSPEGEEAEPKPAEKPGSLGRKLAAKMMSGDSSF